jgi:DMSO/TMAO reductase YedYZ molybdopterin-dependent catalytic subunit
VNAPVRTRRGGKPSSLRYYQDGPPAFVDIQTWSLTIVGEAGADRVLSFADLSQAPWLEESRRYVCVCNWSIRELWGGYLLADVLRLAGWDGGTDGLYLRQTSIGTPEKGVYRSTIPLGDAVSRRAILATRIDGEPLSLERGYPLRLLDFGLYGYKSVKGLARLEITTAFELGEWERKAGYALDGELKPKRYRMCDLNRHEFLARPGEVTEF